MTTKSPRQRSPVKRQILIVDDHPLVRRGLTALINCEADLIVSGQAATRREGLTAIASCRPDLVIADLSLGDDDGLVLVREIRLGDDSLPILVLTMHDGPAHLERVFRAGASGYVSKQELTDVLLIGIRRVLAGERYVSPRMKPRSEPA